MKLTKYESMVMVFFIRFNPKESKQALARVLGRRLN